MNADVSPFPAVHPWTQTPIASSLNLTPSNTSAWVFPSPLATHDSSRKIMHPGEPDPSPDPHVLEAHLDFFHKLGYSTAQVQAVQQKFGSSMDTDKVLGELVRIGAGREAEQGPVTTMSVLVSRGDTQAAGPTLLLPVSGTSYCSREDSGEEEDALRPVVIDGSNVAMRWEN